MIDLSVFLFKLFLVKFIRRKIVTINMVNIENLIVFVMVIMVIVSVGTFILLYFVLKLIRKNNELIEKERPEMLRDVKKFLKK